MRWDGLFADLEAQAGALDTAERAAEIEERARIGFGELRLIDRLRAAADAPLRLSCSGGISVDGVLRRVGADWLLLDEGGGRESIVVLAAVLSVRGLGRLSAAPDSVGVVESRLGMRYALRGVVRDRSPVHVHLHDGTVLFGTPDRVAADYLELAVHPTGERRRRDDVRDVLAVALGGLVTLRRDA